MVILTLNCGSSSVKYQVYDWETKDTLATGIVERVAIGGSSITHRCGGQTDYVLQHECPTHTVAIELILNTLVPPSAASSRTCPGSRPSATGWSTAARSSPAPSSSTTISWPPSAT